jgi:hypothetical protein
MKKLSRKLLVFAAAYLIVNGSLLVSLTGPVMEENNLSIIDLLLNSESRAIYKEEVVNAAQEKGNEISKNFFGYLVDEIKPSSDAKPFTQYNKAAYDVQKRIQSKKVMDIEYENSYKSND